MAAFPPPPKGGGLHAASYMTSIVIAIVCLAAGVFAGYYIGIAPGATFVEKAKSYFILKS